MRTVTKQAYDRCMGAANHAQDAPFGTTCPESRGAGSIAKALPMLDAGEHMVPVHGVAHRIAPDEEIAATIRATVHEKWLGHEINSAKFVAPPRPMYAIGG